MSSPNRLIRKYIWIINTILKAKQITLKDINKYWLEDTTTRLKEEGKISERTFFRYKNAIYDLFGISIGCHHNNGNTYFIKNSNTLIQPSPFSWVFSGLACINLFIDNEKLKDGLIFEDSLGGYQYIAPIVESIEENHVLRITYLAINTYFPIEIWLNPFFLKQYKQNWYVLGKVFNEDTWVSLSLGSIITLTQTQAKDYYGDTKECKSKMLMEMRLKLDETIGVDINEALPCESVVVRVHGKQRGYISALPLHKSQRLIASTKDYVDYEYNLIPNYNFQSEILRCGNSVEILSPLWLREEFIKMIESIKQLYTLS